MRISLIDVDGHNFPNLPLMKLSAWHKQNGDQVEWYDPLTAWLNPPDRVYMSKVFTFTPDYPHPVCAGEIVKGGTGYEYPSGGKPLPEEIEHIYPDYSLYPELCNNTAYGFLTRGCPRGCDFCIVKEKEHAVFDMETFEEEHVIDYYVPYDIQESSKNKPTVTDEFLENAYLTEGYYECEYELLLTCGEATRRLVIPQRTVNVPMISLLSNIEDEIRDILYGYQDEDNDFADVLELVDEHYEIKMFDDYGIPANIEINHADDFVNMIVSARQIKCEFKYSE